MSDTEQSPETIQAPIKRKYTRKPKVVDDGRFSRPSSGAEPTVEPPVGAEIKPKRAYVRKSKPEIPIHEEPIPEEPIPEPEPVPEPVPEPKEKKPRSEKQISAFNKMREARIKKQAELEELKAFQKEKELLEKEQSKIQKIEDKIVARQSKKRSPKKPKQEQVVRQGAEHRSAYDEPEHIIQVSNNRPIMFV